ncbi:MAG: pentapeptide repeat-containing protein [Roseiarcus sp.]
MAETLLTPSSVKIFGRVVTDVIFNYNQATTVIGGNNLLQRQLSTAFTPIALAGSSVIAANPIVTVTSTAGLEPNMTVSSPTDGAFTVPTTIAAPISSPTQITVSPAPLVNNNNITINVSWQPNLARIYGFSFEGAYYGLPRPSIFLVHGTGTPAGSWAYPSTMEQSGVAAREWDFSGPTAYNPFANAPPYPPVPNPLDLFYWEYEKGDFSIRFDTEAGPFEQILLVAMLRAGADMADRATPRSGASLSGASLAGASLSGASLSGASLSGASLSGASLRGR